MEKAHTQEVAEERIDEGRKIKAHQCKNVFLFIARQGLVIGHAHELFSMHG